MLIERGAVVMTCPPYYRNGVYPAAFLTSWLVRVLHDTFDLLHDDLTRQPVPTQRGQQVKPALLSSKPSLHDLDVVSPRLLQDVLAGQSLLVHGGEGYSPSGYDVRTLQGLPGAADD